MKNNKIRTMAYMALYAALYIVLKYVGNLIPFFDMPNGGSIELELIAVFIASYHLGFIKGALTGLLSWGLSIVLQFPMYFVSPAQIILDYAGPLALCGMASLLWPFEKVSKPVAAVLAVIIAIGSFAGIYNSFGAGMITMIVAVVIGLSTGAFTFWYVIEKKKFGIVIAMLLKYVCTVLSGVYFWFPESATAGSPAAWTYSLGYNLWYNLVTMIVCIIIVPMLIERLKKSGVRFIA